MTFPFFAMINNSVKVTLLTNQMNDYIYATLVCIDGRATRDFHKVPCDLDTKSHVF